jgi:hypothetical protein
MSATRMTWTLAAIMYLALCASCTYAGLMTP